MYLVVNIVGLLVFLALGWALSSDRKHINWTSVGIMVALNLVIAGILTYFEWGRNAVKAAANGFAWLVSVANEGISFALGWWTGNTPPVDKLGATFVVSALMPILLVVPMFDILTYIGFLPWVIKWIGRGLSFVTRMPKFETFYSVEMMFLGNTEALAVSKVQLQRMSARRNLVLAMMSMSCVTASILAAYTSMVPGEYVLTAVPLNCINALLVANMLYPVEVSKEEDVIYGITDTEETAAIAEVEGGEAVATADKKAEKPQKPPFFSFLGDSILGAGKLILIIIANVVAFVALAALFNKILGAFWSELSLQSILGVIMYIPSLLLGLDPTTAWDMAQNMGLKLVTNEFVVMGEVTGHIANYAEHYKAVLTVFLTSFANFGTLGMIIGCFKGIVDDEKNKLISQNVWRIFVSGILVSLLSAGMVGLFVW